MGGMLVAMPTAMPLLPLTSRFGKRAGRNLRVPAGFVVVRAPIHRFLFRIAQKLHGRLRQTGLGITHGGGAVAVDAAEVAMAVRPEERAWRSPAPRRTMVSYTAESPCGWYLPITSPTVRADLLCGRLGVMPLSYIAYRMRR